MQVRRGNDLFDRTAIAALSRPPELQPADRSTVLRRVPPNQPPPLPNLRDMNASLANRPQVQPLTGAGPHVPAPPGPPRGHCPPPPPTGATHRSTQSLPNWCHPSVDLETESGPHFSRTRAESQTGATRQLHVRPQFGAARQSKPDESSSVPPVSCSDDAQLATPNSCHPPQLVPPAGPHQTRNWCHPPNRQLVPPTRWISEASESAS